MKVKIEINCETVGGLLAHLAEISKTMTIRSKGNDEHYLEGGAYGTHEVEIVEEGVENTPTVRFLLPSDEQLIKFAVLFNNGKLEPEKIADMLSMARLLIDRLYENGNVLIPTSKQLLTEK